MTGNIIFKKLATFEEMRVHYELIKDLTKDLSGEQYEKCLKEMIPHNYFQVCAILNDQVIGLSGYWIASKIYCGKYLEIDNFIVSASYRNEGLGKAMLDWMEEEAKIHDCKVMMLDAYVENYRAHQFYYRNGFVVRGFHFLKPVIET